jgi:hypothetical protein
VSPIPPERGALSVEAENKPGESVYSAPGRCLRTAELAEGSRERALFIPLLPALLRRGSCLLLFFTVGREEWAATEVND